MKGKSTVFVRHPIVSDKPGVREDRHNSCYNQNKGHRAPPFMKEDVG